MYHVAWGKSLNALFCQLTPHQHKSIQLSTLSAGFLKFLNVWKCFEISCPCTDRHCCRVRLWGPLPVLLAPLPSPPAPAGTAPALPPRHLSSVEICA